MRRLAVISALAALGVSACLGIGAEASGSAAKCNRDGKRVLCPTSKLRGPKGLRGPEGPAGPVTVVEYCLTNPPCPYSFAFRASADTATTSFAGSGGIELEAGCDGAGELSEARIRASADDIAARIVNLSDHASAADRELDTGDTLNLLPGVRDASRTLTFLNSAGQSYTVHYAAFDGGGIAGGSDCAIYGTIAGA